MILSIVVILVAGLVGYIWSTRGFYNALIHMLCTIIAGAIAFALWEPVSYFWLTFFMRNNFGIMSESAAWGLGLALPFGISLGILRAITDSILRGNILVTTPVNYAGGAVCGIIIGTITAGILTISISNLRIPTKFLGHQPYQYETTGNLVRKDRLLFPVDEITAGLYGALSERAFATSEPLARWHPDAALEGSAMRVSYNDGGARNTIRPNEVTLVKRFAVKGDLKSLLSDQWETVSQQATTADGKPYDPNSRIEGFVLKFGPGSGEKSGKVIVGAGQVRLLVADQNDEQREMYFPVAVSSQAELVVPSENTKPQDLLPRFARWRYNAREVFISSVGGGADAYFGFEFVVPNNYNPVALYVRGSRIDLRGKAADITFPSAAIRDAAILNLPAFVMGNGGGQMANIDTSAVVQVKRGEGSSAALPGIRTGDNIGWTIQLGQHGKLEIDEDEESKFRNMVKGGEALWDKQDVIKMRTGGLEKALRVERFVVEPDTTLVHITVSGNDFKASPASMLGPVASQMDLALSALLVDTNGQSYPVVGFQYEDEVKVMLRYTPDKTIDALSELPTITRSRAGEQQMTLIFRVSKNATIQYYVIGNKAITEYVPPVEAK